MQHVESLWSGIILNRRTLSKVLDQRYGATSDSREKVEHGTGANLIISSSDCFVFMMRKRTQRLIEKVEPKAIRISAVHCNSRTVSALGAARAEARTVYNIQWNLFLDRVAIAAKLSTLLLPGEFTMMYSLL